MGHIWLVLTIVEALYGGLHLLAWNASFCTDVERSLWHLSAIAVVCLGEVPHVSSLFALDALVQDYFSIMFNLESRVIINRKVSGPLIAVR